MAKTCVRSSQHLEISPAEAQRFQSGFHVSVPDVVPPHGLFWVLRSEYPCFGVLAYQFHPFPQLSGGFWGNGNRAPGRRGFGRIDLAPVKTLFNNHLAAIDGNTLPL